MVGGKLWTVHDRFGNAIYLTRERWEHIIDPDNHAEVEPFLDLVAETVRLGRRRQDPYDPRSYQYYRAFLSLPDDNTHVVVGVRFRWRTDEDGAMHEEKFVTTAYLKCLEGEI